jgi:hypothetical protein
MLFLDLFLQCPPSFCAIQGLPARFMSGTLAHCPRSCCPLQALAASSMPRYRGGALKGTASTMTELRLLYDFD